MKTETIEKIFNFLEEKEGKEIPHNLAKSIEKLKLIEELENHPDGVQYRYDGHLFLSGSNIKKLPNDLYVDGSLYLKETNITELPNKLYVKGYFYIRGTSIEELPNNLYVGLNLYIGNTLLADKYTEEQIREIVNSTGGIIKGGIFW